MFWGLRRALRSVVAAEVLAQIGWTVVELGGRVGLLAVTPTQSVIVPPRGRVRGMLDVIGGLVEAHGAGLDTMMNGTRDGHKIPELFLDQALSRADRLVPPGAEIVIASGFDAPGEGLADRLNALDRRRFSQLILITDAEAAQLPQGRYPLRLPDGRHVRVSLGVAGDDVPGMLRPVAGRQALVINAGDPVENTARRIAASFPLERVA